MSPTVASMPTQPKGIKGKKVVGRPSRFDPSEPFHMSTRGGSKKSNSGDEPSAAGSVEDFESRRTSLDAERPVTANSNGTHESKGTFASDYSPPQPIPDIEMSEAQPDETTSMAINGQRKSRSLSRDQHMSPTRKRKRSSPSPPPAPPKYETDPTDGPKNNAPLPEGDYDSDTVEVVHQDDLSDREESGDEAAEDNAEDSPDSSQSQEIVQPYDAVAGTSVDVTPMISEQASPATSGSSEEEYKEQNTTIAKPLAAALQEVAEAKNDDHIEPEQPEDEPMLDAAPGVEDGYEIEEQVRTDEEGRMVVRRGRFGGRRRAQHPNLDIEVAMRRQAHLKSAFRAIARVQKSILAEITQRNIDDLEAKPNLHTEVNEYEGIIQELDAAMARRKAAIQAQHEMKMKQLRITWDGEQEAVIGKCRQQLEDVEESKIDQLQYEFLRIARNAQLEDGNETEDEDEVIPRLKRTGYHFKRGVGLDPAYDSRSRLAIEIQSAAKDMESRYNMYEVLKDLPDEDRLEKRKDFTVMDERPRTAASKKREGQDNLDVLVAAGAETERIASIPVIPNEQAIGLQLLGDLAQRPSIVGGRPQSSGSHAGQMTGVSGPPQLHLHVPSGRSPIQVQMSPRTQHAMGNRFEPGHMPPPLTPRAEIGMPSLRSPDTRRYERRPSSPGRGERPNGLHGSASGEVLRSPARPQMTEVDTLHHRIASRDGMLQESLFGSPRAFAEFSNWRPLNFEEAPRRRTASHSDMARPFGIRSDPSHDGRREEQHHQPGRPAVFDEHRDEPPRFDPVRPQTLRWPDQHSSAGASSGRSQGNMSPRSEQLSMIGTPGANSAGPNRQRPGSKGSKSGQFHKTSKAERNGMPRRRNKDKKQPQQMQQQPQRENGQSEHAGTPTMGPAQYAGSPPTDMRPPSPSAPWFASIRPPSQDNRPLRHHSGSYNQPSPHAFHPHPAPHPPTDYGLQHHRGSLPPSMAGFGWRQPPSPLFAGPPPVPPPPGVDNWRHFPPPPPPPGFQPPPQTPHTSHPQSTPVSAFGGNNNNNTFRGPPIAPAGNFQPGGFRPGAPMNHPPAFAQQQQQSGGSFGGGNRRRAASDASFPKFQPLWTPKSPRR